MEDLKVLANLIKQKNQIDNQISQLIGRPALICHVGEYIASKVFDIRLKKSAAQKAIDGVFQSGQLVGKSVNIKWYAKQEMILDITPEALPDYYLILTGPVAQPVSSYGTTRPWIIVYIYLFDAVGLVDQLRQRNIKIGVATSVAKQYWDAAEVYPEQSNKELSLDEHARRQLAFFNSANRY